jgi:hypothetical protein
MDAATEPNTRQTTIQLICQEIFATEARPTTRLAAIRSPSVFNLEANRIG